MACRAEPLPGGACRPCKSANLDSSSSTQAAGVHACTAGEPRPCAVLATSRWRTRQRHSPNATESRTARATACPVEPLHPCDNCCCRSHLCCRRRRPYGPRPALCGRQRYPHASRRHSGAYAPPGHFASHDARTPARRRESVATRTLALGPCERRKACTYGSYSAGPIARPDPAEA